jgi:hypothetical protein
MKILKMASRIIIVSVIIVSISYFVSSSIAHYLHPQMIDTMLTESGTFSFSEYEYEQSFSRIFALMTPILTIIYSSIYLVLRKRYYKKYESKK